MSGLAFGFQVAPLFTKFLRLFNYQVLLLIFGFYSVQFSELSEVQLMEMLSSSNCVKLKCVLLSLNKTQYVKCH
jgi:hypothetical protein